MLWYRYQNSTIKYLSDIALHIASIESYAVADQTKNSPKAPSIDQSITESIEHPSHTSAYLSMPKDIREVFNRPEHQIQLRDGDILLRQGEANKRLFLVIRGCLISDRTGNHIDHLEAETGDFIGIRSFFEREHLSRSTVTSRGDSTIAWIEDIPCKPGQTPENVLMPMILQTLERRQAMMYQMKERQQQQEQQRLLHMQKLERLSLLGQFSAGVAHELNNAIAVTKSAPDWIAQHSNTLLAHQPTDIHTAFEHGRQHGRSVDSRTARSLMKELESIYGLKASAARRLAKSGFTHKQLQQMKKLLRRHPEDIIQAWEFGATIHDLQTASAHAATVIQSMKLLGAADDVDPGEVNIRNSIQQALSISRPVIESVEVHLEYADDDCLVCAHEGKLIQAWVNIIKNSCEAMNGTANPTLTIAVNCNPDQVIIDFIDNGHGIEPSLREKIFQPDVSTKKSGLSFGLGIGLSIVQRIISHAGGTIVAMNNPERGARMSVTLPPTTK